MKVLCECASNVFNANIPFDLNPLITHERQLKVLCNAGKCGRKRRRILSHNNGINLMQENSFSFFTSNKMSSQDFAPLPKQNYGEEQPNSSEVLFHPTITKKAKHLTLLRRQKHTVRKDEKSTDSQLVEYQTDSLKK